MCKYEIGKYYYILGKNVKGVLYTTAGEFDPYGLCLDGVKETKNKAIKKGLFGNTKEVYGKAYTGVHIICRITDKNTMEDVITGKKFSINGVANLEIEKYLNLYPNQEASISEVKKYLSSLDIETIHRYKERMNNLEMLISNYISKTNEQKAIENAELNSLIYSIRNR